MLRFFILIKIELTLYRSNNSNLENLFTCVFIDIIVFDKLTNISLLTYAFIFIQRMTLSPKLPVWPQTPKTLLLNIIFNMSILLY